ncbi:polysaccharide deacetylase family protein [Mariluticola halotolerans]|uniref:polysaccharide deacetylase family protein n=1 Tax=Mariluticola halotolerans TaxID=2909283 RepID=UPI0026E214A1|nr:polysaccharide deacetylase family protein [Mariluticola halotolerans]UJQ95184.1 polysaccharide deacetylase family protein [Mariluticola halotolerans]
MPTDKRFAFPTRRTLLLHTSALALTAVTGVAFAEKNDKPLEPGLRIAAGDSGPRGIAITLDACSGGIDHRILDVLIAEHIPVTLFVTARWLAANPDTFAQFLAHPDLFQIENHGAEHIPPVLGTEKVYGITPAGTPQAIADEVSGGEAALMAAGAPRPRWYRGATALYSPDAIPLIQSLGYAIAGFSLNADYGASASADTAEQRIRSARDGDVVIAHINQPTRAAGEGIARGLVALKRAGAHFVRLDAVTLIGE